MSAARITSSCCAFIAWSSSDGVPVAVSAGGGLGMRSPLRCRRGARLLGGCAQHAVIRQRELRLVLGDLDVGHPEALVEVGSQFLVAVLAAPLGFPRDDAARGGDAGVLADSA